MLSQEDLKQIGQVIREQVPVIIKEEVPAIVREIIKEEVPPIVRTVVQEVIDDPEGAINTKFDAVQDQLDEIDTRLISVEASMVTKSYLDDKLAHYEKRPF